MTPVNIIVGETRFKRFLKAEEAVMDVQIIPLMPVKLMAPPQTQGQRLSPENLTALSPEKCLKSAISHHSVTSDIDVFDDRQLLRERKAPEAT